MRASLVIITSTLVTLLTTGGIMGLTITGEPSVNGTLGGNVNITWKVQNIVKTSFNVFINNIESENLLFDKNEFGVNKSLKFSEGDPGRHDKLRKRSSTYYYYTGKSGGQETGQVVLTIKGLKFEDNSRFLLLDGFSATIKYVATVLSVQYGPEKCGSGLESEYSVNQGDKLNVTMGFCGKPQPIMTCELDGQPGTNTDGTEVSQYNYTYTFVIPTNLEPCKKKQLICTATGHGKSITKEVIVGRKFPEEKKVSSGVCAGHIVGFEIGVILICVFIYVYLVVWKATDGTGKRVGSIIAVVVGFALVFALSVSYADLRNSNDNDNCGKGSLDVCDKVLIAFGVIDFVTLFIVVIISVKVLKGRGPKTLDRTDSRHLFRKGEKNLPDPNVNEEKKDL